MRTALFACCLLLALSCQASQDGSEKPFYKTLKTPPAPVLNPEQAQATFVLAPGYRIELVAAEPLIEDPVAADWDEAGNLYVAEMRAYMPELDGEGENQPIGAVVRISDSDGDGQFDRREELINDLVLPRAVRIVNQGLLVAEKDKLWLCPSASGWSKDIDCSAKRYLGEYGVHQGSVEHAENGLLVGMDNWIYSAKSARRLQLARDGLVEEPSVFRGQWGITQDDAGRLFYNTNSNLLLGDFYDAAVIAAAGNTRAPGLNQRISPDDEVFSVRVNPGVNRAYLPGVLRADGRLRSATSASGMVIYRGGLFAADAPDAFVTEPAANVVAAFKLREKGLKVSAERRLYDDATWGQRDFLASTDERFRPVDVFNGPDGALYVLDFYRGVIQDHVYLSEQLKQQAIERGLDRPVGMGRIWRVVPVTSGTDEGQVQVSPGLRSPCQALDENVNAPGFISDPEHYLSADNAWCRMTAHRLLLRDERSTRALKAMLRDKPDGLAAAHALWILDGQAALDASDVRRGIAIGSTAAEAALLAGGQLLAVGELVKLVRKAPRNTRVHLYAVGALRHHIQSEQAVDTLVALLLGPQAEDEHVLHTALAALRGAEHKALADLMQAYKDESKAASVQLEHLSRQFFRAEGANAAGILDLVLNSPQPWLQRALLSGLYETSREPDFERVVLDGPHALFEQEKVSVWPDIARARRGFTWPGDTLAADAKPLNAEQQVRMARGAAFYASSCANCHGADGAGVGAAGPPLADSPWVTEAPERLIRIVLQGVSGPIEVAGQTWNSAMPGHQHYPGFDDEVAAGLLTYLRRSWGHAGRAIEPQFVARAREQTKGRTALWTADELASIRINTHYEKYVGGYGDPRRPMKLSYDGRDLILDAGIFSGPVVELKEDVFLFEPRNIQLEFELDDRGSVTGVSMSSGDGARSLPKVSSASG